MTTAQYGVAELSNNLTEMLLPVITVSAYTAMMRFVLDPGRDPEGVFSNGMAVFAGGIVIGVAAAVGIGWATRYPYIREIVLVLLSNACWMMVADFMRGMERVWPFAVCSVINGIALFGFDMLFLVRMGLGAAGYLDAIAAANALAVLVLFIWTRCWRYLSIQKISGEAVAEMIRFGLPITLTTLAWWLCNMPERYFILWFCGESAAGIFAAASKLPAIVTIATNTFQQAWQLSSSRETGSGDAPVFYSNVYRLYSAFALAACSLAIGASPWLTELLLKGDFERALPYLPLLMVSALLNCYLAYFGTLYIAYKDTRRLVHSSAAGALSNVLICWGLIPAFGIWGALAATNISSALALLMRIRDARRLLGMDFSWRMNGMGLGFIALQALAISLGWPMSRLWGALGFAGTFVVTGLFCRRAIGKLIRSVPFGKK